ncbi:hypothetical protein BX667DRAFT_312112 [Coemansia mojavensis]|nr:hypothetical protein BX667DRAFT_312112 [Coemansia mojavensis]
MSVTTCTVPKFFKPQPTAFRSISRPHPYKRRLLCKFQPSRLKNRQTATADMVIARYAHNHAQPKISASTCSVTKISKTKPTELKSKPQPYPHKRRPHTKFQLGLLKNHQTPTANTIIARYAHNHAQPKMSVTACAVTKIFKPQPTALKSISQPHPYKRRPHTKFQLGLLKTRKTATVNSIIANHAHSHAQPKIAANTFTVAKFSKSQPIELKLNTQPHPHKRRLLCKFQPSLLKTRQTPTANTIIANHAHNHAQPKIATNTCTMANFFKTQLLTLIFKTQPYPYKRRLPTMFQPSRLKNRQTATANTITTRHAHNHAQPKIATNTSIETNFFKTQPFTPIF